MVSNSPILRNQGSPAGFRAFFLWAQRALRTRKTRRLRVCESLSLGERRFVAVIEFDSQEFLVGGTGTSLALLARLQDGMILPETPAPTPNRLT